MIQQKWKIENEDGIFEIKYSFSRLRGITIAINEDRFVLPAGFLGFSAARREIFRVGGEQAVLAVARSGRAELIFGGESLSEL